MEDFRQINRTLGWIVFVFASATYLTTIEPTVSLWDCGEFITSAFKLEVGHPPGAPFFMIVARVCALFTSDVTKVALMMNAFSAIISAATIMFLYWTITHLAIKIYGPVENLSRGKHFAIISAGFIGAMACAFTDTFWFSAVETEVYAFSSFFTSVVFWAILKWEEEDNKLHANRWIILIAYLMGLSIGVHLLNLLAIPAIVFIYYFKKYKTTQKGVIAAALLSFLFIVVIMYGIIPGTPMLASWFELLFVNSLGLPYNSGLLFFLFVVIAGLACGIYFTLKKGKVLANTILTAIVVIIIGYSSYAVIVIRSGANPPIDENNPEDVFSLLFYLNREQYGNRPLFYGQYYNSEVEKTMPGKKVYTKQNGRYVVTNETTEYKYDPAGCTIFPRMYSDRPFHVDAYKEWGKIKNVKKPTFGENLRFFFSYQIGHMYWRYFMWNFAGRQNDEQSHGSYMKGNWLSGIGFLDQIRLGPQDNLPDDMKNTPSRNTYFLLPLILGLIGMFFHYKSGENGQKDFWVVMLLFFFTGIAIVLYLNQKPMEPRERDYAYVGSFYAFAIWIGLGVLGIFQFFSKKLPELSSSIITSVICLAVPGILLAENLDDHDRSGRTLARDFGTNYLESCAPNAILFTYGDNDTFPLWYAQEVEGVRPDVRICNLSLLGMDWYITQMQMAANESAPVPFNMKEEKYLNGTRDFLPVADHIKQPVELKKIMDFVANDNKRTQVQLQNGDWTHYIPSRNVFLNVDSAKITTNGTVKLKDAHRIVDTLQWKLTERYYTKSDMAILEILARNNWERPIYFDLSAQNACKLNLNKYLQHEGFAYRLVPIKAGKEGSVDSDILYNNLMNKFRYGNLNDPHTLCDEFAKREVMVTRLKETFLTLAETLIEEGKQDSALKVLNRVHEILPDSKIPYTFENALFAEQYFRINQAEKGAAIMRILAEKSYQRINYFVNLPTRFYKQSQMEMQRELQIFTSLIEMAAQYKQMELSKELDNKLKSLSNKLSALG